MLIRFLSLAFSLFATHSSGVDAQASAGAPPDMSGYDPTPDGETPCATQSCCFDTVCCGPGTVWDGSLCVVLPSNTCTIPNVPFDYAEKCFVAKCKEKDCCGPGTELVMDPSRDDPACYCSTSCDEVSLCRPGQDVSECKPGKDGKDHQPKGEKLDISNADCVFIADDVTPKQKKGVEEIAGKIPTHSGLTSWDDLIAKLEKKVKPVRDIVIVGHGANGGVGTKDPASNIDGESITDAQAAKIKACLGENSKILIMSCAQADEEDNDYMQKLANKTMRTVVGNVKDTYADTFKGKGQWLKFEPKTP